MEFGNKITKSGHSTGFFAADETFDVMVQFRFGSEGRETRETSVFEAHRRPSCQSDQIQ